MAIGGVYGVRWNVAFVWIWVYLLRMKVGNDVHHSFYSINCRQVYESPGSIASFSKISFSMASSSEFKFLSEAAGFKRNSIPFFDTSVRLEREASSCGTESLVCKYTI